MKRVVFSTADTAFMEMALVQAKKAAELGETPVGAVVVKDGRVLATAYNEREALKDITAHAELTAVRAAAKALGDWRLSGCTVYVTLEPCPMCAGALIASRVSRVVYGAPDPRAGAMGSVLHLPRYPLDSQPTVEGGLLEAACLALLRDFFKNRRK